MLISVHSFTQAWKGVPRPWAVGVLWDKDPRLALALLEGLRAIPDIEVGDNVPYSGQLKGDTLYCHGTMRGLAHALVEVRQDLILGPEGQKQWAMRLARVLGKVLSEPAARCMQSSCTARIPTLRRAARPPGKERRQWTTRRGSSLKLPLSGASSRICASAADVQNIDLMELAGFCRNCLADWYREAAAAKGSPLSREQAREIVYGMAYDAWKAKYQTEAPAKPRKRTG